MVIVSSPMARTGRTSALMLQVHSAEVCNDRIFDLVGGQSKCSLREDATGRLRVRAAAADVCAADGGVSVGGFPRPRGEQCRGAGGPGRGGRTASCGALERARRLEPEPLRRGAGSNQQANSERA